MSGYSLHPSVMETCADEIKKPENQANCNVFLKSVFDRQCVFLPISTFSFQHPEKRGTADDLMHGFNDSSLTLTDMFSFLGRGKAGEAHGVALAAAGKLVVCGLTSEELNKEATRKAQGIVTYHGHVAILSGKIAVTGWPEAYWGMHKKPEHAGKPASLSKCFRAGDRPHIAYYLYA